MENLSREDARAWKDEFKPKLQELGATGYGPVLVSTDPEAYGLRVRAADEETARRIIEAAPEHLRDNFIFKIGEVTIIAYELRQPQTEAETA